MSLDLDIHELRSKGLPFTIIGARLGLTKDQAQKRYRKYLLGNPLPQTPSPEGDRLFSGGPVKKDLTPPTPPASADYMTRTHA